MQRQSALKAAATFIEPMECEPIAQLHEGPQWVYETKLDGYRARESRSSRKPDRFPDDFQDGASCFTQ